MQKVILTIFLAGVGGLIGVKAKIPAGALLDAMIFVAVYNILTGQANIPKNLKVVAQIVVGGMIGLGFTMDTVPKLKKILIPIMILAC